MVPVQRVDSRLPVWPHPVDWTRYPVEVVALEVWGDYGGPYYRVERPV